MADQAGWYPSMEWPEKLLTRSQCQTVTWTSPVVLHVEIAMDLIGQAVRYLDALLTKSSLIKIRQS